MFRSPDGSHYVKVVGAHAVAELAAERDRVSWASEHGIPAPSVVDWGVTDGGGAYLVTTALAGVPADRLTEAGLRAAWRSIVAAVRALHDIPPQACPYRRELDSMLARAHAVVAAGAVNPEFLRDEDRTVPAEDLLSRIERDAAARRTQEARDLVVCHGDLCLPNILVEAEQMTGFIDLGRLGRADRHADLALLLANTADTFPGFGAEAATGLAAEYPAPIDDDRLTYYLGLDPLTWG